MHRFFGIVAAVAMGTTFALAADAPAPGISKIFDRDVTSVEREVVSLAEAMPADKYDFAPTNGEFKTVRTFAQQMRHIAATNYAVAASILGEKCPIEYGSDENGPASIKTRDDIVKFLKDSFAYTHKAMATLTDQNLTEMIASAFGKNKVPRLSMVTVPAWHSFDHYGQAVVYARMNGVVPPASRR
jgi:uncharacterized damage-inducible protein DinB